MLSTRRWWTLALRGGAAALFGVLALLVPDLTLGRLVSLFGVWALADGGLALLAGASAGDAEASRLALAEGVASFAAGTLVLLWPGLSVFVLLTIAALRAVVVGAAQGVEGLALRRTAGDGWLLAIAGAASVAFGLVLVLLPGAGVWWLALSGIVVGALLTMHALRHRDGGRLAAA